MINSKQYQQISQAISLLHATPLAQFSLNELAEKVHMSPYHFQRLFKEWAGISPKRYSQFLLKEAALNELSTQKSILDVSLHLGMSSAGRLHDLMITTEAMTPGEIKLQGQGLTIEYGFAATPFGMVVVGITQRGICHLSFYDTTDAEALIELKKAWPRAKLVQNTEAIKSLIESLFYSEQFTSGTPESISLLLNGSNFQIQVWQALINYHKSTLCSYADLAESMSRPNAQRAIGTALGKNPIAYLIPCHKVIRANLELGGYRWGTSRKSLLQTWEICQQC